jgi:hypothetical protein
MAAAKGKDRSPDAIGAEIARERQALGKAFDALRGDVTEASAAERPLVAMARKAVLFAPAVALAAGATAAGLVAGLRSRTAKSR